MSKTKSKAQEKREFNKMFKEAFAAMDYMFDDLCYYLKRDDDSEYELIYFIKSHKRDLKDYVKKECINRTLSGYTFDGDFIPNPHGLVRYLIQDALCTRGTHQFHCKAPSSVNGHAVLDWVHERNRNHVKSQSHDALIREYKAA